MADLEKKIKEYYDNNALTEIQLHKIQKMMRKPKRRMRILLYGPIAAIFFVVIMGKITFRIIKNDAEMMAPVVMDALAPTAKEEESAVSAEKLEGATMKLAEKPSPTPRQRQQLLAMKKAKRKSVSRDMAGFSVSMAPDLKKGHTAGRAQTAIGGIILQDIIRLSGFGDDYAAFDAELMAHLKGIDEVYRKYLKTSSSLSGRIVYRITVDIDGTVKEAVAEEDKTGNAPFVKTVTAMIKSWEFSKESAEEKVFRIIVECKRP